MQRKIRACRRAQYWKITKRPMRTYLTYACSKQQSNPREMMHGEP